MKLRTYTRESSLCIKSLFLLVSEQ